MRITFPAGRDLKNFMENAFSVILRAVVFYFKCSLILNYIDGSVCSSRRLFTVSNIHPWN